MEKTPLLGRFCCHCGTRLPKEPPADVDSGTDDFSNRVLCSDGNCIGVINAQGVCNECGKPYAEDDETE